MIPAEKRYSEPSSWFHETEIIEKIKHFLPAQLPLKEFIHHNLLHAFQYLSFYEANYVASKIFGYKTYLSLQEYQGLYAQGHISDKVLEERIAYRVGIDRVREWKNKMLSQDLVYDFQGQIGRIMHSWKDYYRVNISKYVQPVLFRVLSNYLDQGIAIIRFPYQEGKSFLENLAWIEQNSYVSYFFSRKGRARRWLVSGQIPSIKEILEILVGDERWYEDYLFDLQFEHPGWSGMVSVIESHPDTLLIKRNISLKELIIFELLLQIDYLDNKLKKWKPLAEVAALPEHHLFDVPDKDESFVLLELWQESLEWSYYESLLHAIAVNAKDKQENEKISFQTIHCLDEREESFRRYIEELAPFCETYSTAGFFNMDFYYQPKDSNYAMKLAPAAAMPKHLIKEYASQYTLQKDISVHSASHSIWKGLLLSQTIGFFSAYKLGFHIFDPHDNPFVVKAEKHSDHSSELICEYKGENIEGWSVGYNLSEAIDKIASLLYSIGMVERFAPLVYVIGHGAGSTNNPYFAAYDCGACSGKPGSVNARVLCYFLNKSEVRVLLNEKGIQIPSDSVFIPALHNSTTDEITFYDLHYLNEEHRERHRQYEQIFYQAMELNAKERSRRFATMDYLRERSMKALHEEVKKRAYSLFEPRPEYNHATNAACIIGRRVLSKKLFLDRRVFLNSYDYRYDPKGVYLKQILKAITVVGGGINLEYYYSRVDNEKLGAGSKLPHNVYGLIGVANGADGDLRYGLPKQMVEIHDPLRLMIIVEQYPEIVLNVLRDIPEIMEWYDNAWIHLMVYHPETGSFYLYNTQQFSQYISERNTSLPSISCQELLAYITSSAENLPIVRII